MARPETSHRAPRQWVLQPPAASWAPLTPDPRGRRRPGPLTALGHCASGGLLPDRQTTDGAALTRLLASMPCASSKTKCRRKTQRPFSTQDQIKQLFPAVPWTALSSVAQPEAHG